MATRKKTTQRKVPVPSAAAIAKAPVNGVARPNESATTDTMLTAERPLLTLEAIRVRAYELYLQRGAADGGDVIDWLRAERELSGQGTKAL